MVKKASPMMGSKRRPHGEMQPLPAVRETSGGSPNLNGLALGGTGENEEEVAE